MTGADKRWATALSVAHHLDTEGVKWAVSNGIHVGDRRVGRDVDLWIHPLDRRRAMAVTIAALRDIGWQSVWHRRINLVDQVIGFELTPEGPQTVAFDLLGDRDWWSVAGVGIDTEPFQTSRQGAFNFSQMAHAFKVTVMPFLGGDHERFLSSEQGLDPEHFGVLAASGDAQHTTIAAWIDRHPRLFGGGKKIEANELELAATDLRRTVGLSPTLRRLRTTSRKALAYAAGSVAYPPVSLTAVGWSTNMLEQLLTLCRNTFIDVLRPQPNGRRIIPRRPVSGITLHVSDRGPGKPGVRLAADTWGLSWRFRLGRAPRMSWEADGVHGALQALQDVYDAACTP